MRQYPAIYVCCSKLWQSIDGMAAFELRGHTCSTQHGIPGGSRGGNSQHGVLPAFGGIAQVQFFSSRAECRDLAKVFPSDLIGFKGKTEIGKTGERGREAVDGVVRNGQRAVTTFVVYFEAKIEDILFANLQIVSDVFAIDDFAPTAFVKTELRVD